MAIEPKDMPRILIERIAYAHPAPALFSAGEVDEWPDGTLLLLLATGVLIEAGARATTAVCTGCEVHCIKPAAVRMATDNTKRAFVVCDEAPDLGRIELSMRSLVQYVASLRALAVALAQTLPLRPSPSGASASTFALGSWTGRRGNRGVQIAVEDAIVMLGVGRQVEPLSTVLTWTSSGLALNVGVIRRLADRKEPPSRSGGKHTPDRSRQMQRAHQTRARDAAIYKEAKRLKSSGLRTWTAVAQSIAKAPLGNGLSIERIRRIIVDARMRERKKSRSKSASRKLLPE